MPVRTERKGRREGVHEFTLVLEGADELDPSNLDAWFEAGFDDATFAEVDGVGYADFTRRAASAPAAILLAIHQLESAVPSVRVVRVEPDDLVNASDVARRLERSRESVRLLIAGERGPGGFPLRCPTSRPVGGCDDGPRSRAGRSGYLDRRSPTRRPRSSSPR